MPVAGRPRLTDADRERGKALAARLKRARTERYSEDTLEAFAVNAGLSPNTLKKLERGQANPGIFTVAGVAEALGLSLDELVGRQ